ncbi:hypothetical protein [Metabacillus niabensis]
MEKIIEQNREEKEMPLLFFRVISFLTFKKIRKIEQKKMKLKEELYID